jgi:integrase
MIRESTGRGSTLGIASHPLTTRRATTHVEAYALGMVSAADRAEQQQAGEKLRAADYGDSGLVFATGKGTPLDAQNIINRFFKPLLKRAELPDIRWHDLRHTYATLLLARGTHPTYVQKSLGHASVQLTLDRYSHWMPSMGRNTAEGIDEALG